LFIYKNVATSWLKSRRDDIIIAQKNANKAEPRRGDIIRKTCKKKNFTPVLGSRSMLTNELNDEECDATDDAISTTAGNKKIICQMMKGKNM